MGVVNYGLIERLYIWFWRDLLQRREPFTFQLRRMLSNPGCAWCWVAAGSATAAFITWLLLHLGDFL